MNRSSLKQGVLSLTVFVVATLLGLALAEGMVRLFAHATPFASLEPAPVFDESLKNHFFVPDKVLGYAPGPLWSSYRGGRYGYQNGKEYDGDTAPKTDVAFLGDSIIQFHFLADEMRDLLPKDRYRVWNAGIGGYNTIQEQVYLETRITRWPQILFIGFCLNDFIPSMTVSGNDSAHAAFHNQIFEPIGEVSPWLFRNSALYRQLILLKMRAKLINIYSPEMVERNRSVVKNALARTQALAAQKKMRVILVIFPYLGDYAKIPWLTRAHETVLRIAHELNMPTLDTHELLRPYPFEKLRFNQSDSVHPSRFAHSLIARELINQYGQELGLSKDEAKTLAQNPPYSSLR